MLLKLAISSEVGQLVALVFVDNMDLTVEWEYKFEVSE